MAKLEIVWCDHCGEDISDPAHQCPVTKLKQNIDSANAGESAVLCIRCFKHFESDDHTECEDEHG